MSDTNAPTNTNNPARPDASPAVAGADSPAASAASTTSGVSAATDNGPILAARGLHKTYRLGGVAVPVLQGVDLDLHTGEMLAVLGRSGSGKSTLLHLLGGLERPDRGGVRFRGQSVYTTGRHVNRYRNRDVGFVFQFYHLLPELTALENAQLTAMIGRHGKRSARKQRAAQLLERVGLKDRMKHRPNKLSGGERQRVAIARALMNEPAVLLADEPTGNLDAQTGGSIMELFGQLHADGQTLVLVTHDDNVARQADRVVTLVGGMLGG